MMEGLAGMEKRKGYCAIVYESERLLIYELRFMRAIYGDAQ